MVRVYLRSGENGLPLPGASYTALMNPLKNQSPVEELTSRLRGARIVEGDFEGIKVKFGEKIPNF